jgi:hypothetical protein
MALLLLDSPAWLPVSDAFVGEANAIIGRPITPVSYAAVARRTSPGVGPIRLTAGGQARGRPADRNRRGPAAVGVRIEPSQRH